MVAENVVDFSKYGPETVTEEKYDLMLKETVIEEKDDLMVKRQTMLAVNPLRPMTLTLVMILTMNERSSLAAGCDHNHQIQRRQNAS